MRRKRQASDRTIDVRIEIPRGSRSKYEYDTKSGQLRLKQVLSSSVHYPVDYGFVLDTLGRDGDELDVLLLTEEPAVPASVQTARPIGVLEMTDGKGPDEKVLAVPAGDPQRIHDAVAIRVRCPQVGHVIRHGSHVSKANCPQ